MRYLQECKQPLALLHQNFGLRFIDFALATLAAFAFTSNSFADGFDAFGDQGRLENQVIIAAGTIGERTSLASQSTGSSSSNRQKQSVFEIGQFCFRPTDSFNDVSGKLAFLLIDSLSRASVAVMTTSLQSLRVKLIPIDVLDCTGLTLQEINKSRDQDHERVQQQLEALRQQRAMLEQMMKTQREAAKKSQ